MDKVFQESGGEQLVDTLVCRWSERQSRLGGGEGVLGVWEGVIVVVLVV